MASQVLDRAQRHPLQVLSWVGLLVAVLAFLAAVGNLLDIGNDLSSIVRHAWYGVWTVGWMMAVSFHLRTTRLRHVVRAWLTGFFAALGLVLVVVGMTEWLVGAGNLRTAFIVPIVEEVMKAVPLLVIAVLALRGRVAEPSITDFVILGYAIGAGFGVHEDALWVRSVSTGFGSSVWGTLFPSFLWQQPFVVAHAGWTALVGLGIGLTWHFRRLKVGWLLAAVPLAMAIMDHMSVNWRGDASNFLRSLTADGRMPAWVLLVGFLLALALDQWVLHRELGDGRLPQQFTVRGAVTNARRLPTPVTRLGIGMLLVGRRRVLNGQAYRAYRGDPTEAVLGWRDQLLRDDDAAASTSPPAADDTGG